LTILGVQQSAPSTLYRRLVENKEAFQSNVASVGTWAWERPAENPHYEIVVERVSPSLETMDHWTDHQQWRRTVLINLCNEVTERHTI